ncbi:hypothetical protein [Dongia deserti]|uniref:hypothetical protein n=1 Tax=Dongia deserti TaxID=2268030 RepID=UPI000E64DE88|nr:hypothetical protein [Dongia deserti]
MQNDLHAIARLQGLTQDQWLTDRVATLARDTNDLVRAIAARELELGQAPGDFAGLLLEAAQRAQSDADSGS